MGRLTALLRRIMRREPTATVRRIDREIDDELSFHLEMRTRENIAAGKSPEEARELAEKRLGRLDKVRRHGREIRGDGHGRLGAFLADLRQDVRYAMRTMAATPGISVSALLALALGMGATTAVFSVIDGVLLEEIPYADPERIVVVRHGALREHYDLFATELDSIESIGLFSVSSHLLTGIPEPLRVSGMPVTKDFFSVLGVPAQAGRTLTAADHAPDATPTVVISNEVWRSAYGADPGAVGSQLVIDERPFTVVGVMPPGFRAPRYGTFELWLPWSQVASNGGIAVARRTPDATIERMELEIRALADQLGIEPPPANQAPLATVITAYDAIVGDERPTLQLMAAAVAMVLLIACANVANLLLARSIVRGREISVRAALGASRGRIIRQLLTESGLLALLGGALGLGLAYLALPALLALSPYMPRQENIDLDLRVLAFAFIASMMTGVLVGLVPALLVGSKGNGVGGDGDRSAGTTRGRLRWLDGLVVVEVALALILVAGTGLLLRTFMTLNPMSPGFEVGDRVVFQLRPPEYRYPDGSSRAAFFSRILEDLQAHPEIAEAAAVTVVPFVNVAWVTEARPEGYVADADRLPRIWYERASDNYLDVMGIPLLRGSGLATSTAGEPAAVISQRAARELFPDRDPLGKRLSVQLFDGARDFVVIGVAGDTRRSGSVLRPRPTVWVRYTDHPEDRMWLVARPRNGGRLAEPISDVVRRVDADVPVQDLQPLRQILSDSVSTYRFYAALITTFGSIAVLLASIGFYGVMSYSVSRRTRELGIRMTLGAAPRVVRLAVLRHGLAMTCGGVLLGLAGAVAFVRLLEAQIFAAQPLPRSHLASLALGLVIVGLVASLLPARRATRVDPLIALREQ